MVLPFLNAQSKNFSTSADCALSVGSLYIRMNEAVEMGQEWSPLAFTIDTPIPGALNQSTPLAAAANVASSGLTYLPAGFCTCMYVSLFFLA